VSLLYTHSLPPANPPGWLKSLKFAADCRVCWQVFFTLWARLWALLDPELSTATPLFDPKLRISLPPGAAGGSAGPLGRSAGELFHGELTEGHRLGPEQVKSDQI
jgi:hypothetical protein